MKCPSFRATILVSGGGAREPHLEQNARNRRPRREAGPSRHKTPGGEIRPIGQGVPESRYVPGQGLTLGLMETAHPLATREVIAPQVWYHDAGGGPCRCTTGRAWTRESTMPSTTNGSRKSTVPCSAACPRITTLCPSSK